jgi:hypothetical protein
LLWSGSGARGSHSSHRTGTDGNASRDNDVKAIDSARVHLRAIGLDDLCGSATRRVIAEDRLAGAGERTHVGGDLSLVSGDRGPPDRHAAEPDQGHEKPDGQHPDRR